MGDGIIDLGGGGFDITPEVKALRDAGQRGDVVDAVASRALLDQITTQQGMEE